MSSFIVSLKSIDAITTWLMPKTELELQPFKTVDPTAIGQQLLDLNFLAYNHRYSQKGPTPTYSWNIKGLTRVQLYKTLQCYLYQCTEGDIPDTRIYKYLERELRTLADYIITEIPDYQSHPWE
jgi:hypothetical protein